MANYWLAGDFAPWSQLYDSVGAAVFDMLFTASEGFSPSDSGIPEGFRFDEESPCWKQMIICNTGDQNADDDVLDCHEDDER